MKNIARVLRLVILICPVRMAVYLLLSLPGMVLPAVLLYWQQRIVDDVAKLDLGRPLSSYLGPVWILIGTYMLKRLLELVSMQYMEFGYFRYVLMGLDARIHDKSAQIPLEYYDDAQYYQIVEGAKQASMFLVFTANLAVMSLAVALNLAAVSGYLAAMDPVMTVFVVLVSMPVIAEKLWGAKFRARLLADTVQPSRKKVYAFGLLSTAGTKKEIAHHGAGQYVADKYREACREADGRERYQIRQTGCGSVAFSVLKSLFHAGAVCMMFWLLAAGRITIGAFSVLLSSFSVLTDAFTRLFHHAGEILQTGMMASAFFALMDLEVQDGTGILGEAVQGEKDGELMRLEHVFYRYPNAGEDALKDISLSIQKGEKIAVVGENGAGKTTLAKLLSGFLVPSQGSMEMGGIPRSRLREDSIFDRVSAVYQNFGCYKLTLAQNVLLGDTAGQNAPAGQADAEKIESALSWAGVGVPGRPEEILLGREFGGTEISGGQWQRLALARCRYRQRPIVFLDEPTAAIDPLEERALFGKMEELGRNRTVVLITHRLGAVRSADRIFLLEGGYIAEAGSFAELMGQKGRFYRIWNEQAKWYREDGRG